MKANLLIVLLGLFGLISCASNKSVTSESDNQGISAQMEDEPDTSSPPAPTSESESTPDAKEREADTEPNLDQQELERQRIAAEREAKAERERLQALRQEISKSDAEADSIIRTSQEPPVQSADSMDKDKDTMEPMEEALQKEDAQLESTSSAMSSLLEKEDTASSDEVETPTVAGGAQDFYSEGNVVIQFFASASGVKDFEALSKFGKVIIEEVPGRALYRYNLGYYRNRVEAEIVLSELKGEGWSDAFVKEVER